MTRPFTLTLLFVAGCGRSGSFELPGGSDAGLYACKVACESAKDQLKRDFQVNADCSAFPATTPTCSDCSRRFADLYAIMTTCR